LESLAEGIVLRAAFAVTYLCVEIQCIFCKGRGRGGSLVHQTCRTYAYVAIKGEDIQAGQQDNFPVGTVVQHCGRSPHEPVVSSLLVFFLNNTEKAMTDLV